MFLSFDFIVNSGLLFYGCLIIFDEVLLLSYEDVLGVFMEYLVVIWY